MSVVVLSLRCGDADGGRRCWVRGSTGCALSPACRTTAVVIRPDQPSTAPSRPATTPSPRSIGCSNTAPSSGLIPLVSVCGVTQPEVTSLCSSVPLAECATAISTSELSWRAAHHRISRAGTRPMPTAWGRRCVSCSAGRTPRPTSCEWPQARFITWRGRLVRSRLSSSSMVTATKRCPSTSQRPSSRKP